MDFSRTCKGYCAHCHNTAECQCLGFGSKPYFREEHSSDCKGDSCHRGKCLSDELRIHIGLTTWRALNACSTKLGWAPVPGDVVIPARLEEFYLYDKRDSETLRREGEHVVKTLGAYTEMLSGMLKKDVDQWDMNSEVRYTGGWFTRQIMKHVERFFDFYAIDPAFNDKFRKARRHPGFEREVNHHPLYVHRQPKEYRDTFEKLLYLEDNYPRLFRPPQCYNLIKD